MNTSGLPSASRLAVGGRAAIEFTGGVPTSPLLGPRAANLLAVGSLVAGRFQLLGELGAGASSIVYRALDLTAQVEVALKVYGPASSSPDNQERIRREVAISWEVGHPNLVRVFHQGTAGDLTWLAMELCSGGTLRSTLDGSPVPPKRACALVSQILSGLEALHNVGVVHRDVKPENCFFSADGTLKLGDLGLAQADDLASLTATGAVLGTPRYMAPEVLRGHDATTASDLYAVGIILYELLAGSAPFDGGSAFAVVSQHLAESPDLVALRRLGVPGWLVRVVARLLEKDPRDRFPSARHVLEALKRGSVGFSWPARWRRRAFASAVIAVSVVGLSAMFTAGRPVQLPAISFHGRVLEARNAHGQRLWSRQLPRPIQAAHMGRFGPRGAVAVACAIEAGVVGRTKGAEDFYDNKSSEIHVFDPQGELLRAFPVKIGYHEFVQRYSVKLFSHAFARGEPERLVARAIHIPWYPAALLIYGTDHLRASTVDERIPYRAIYNSGYFDHVAFGDVDGDGRDEIAYAALNNRLYRALVVGLARFTLPPADGLFSVSPDVAGNNVQPLLFFRLVAHQPDRIVGLAVNEARSTVEVSLASGARLTLNPRGELLSSPPAQQRCNGIAAAEITRLCGLRDRGSFHELLRETEGWPRDDACPSSWLGRFLRADALLGLGRAREVPSALGFPSGVAPSGQPDLVNRLLVESAFLAGDYRECLRRYRAIPAAELLEPELGNAATWGAVYAQESELQARFTRNPAVIKFAYVASVVEALGQMLAGDLRAARANLEPWHNPEQDQYFLPSLWLVEVLLREGNVQEARRVLDETTRRFAGDAMDGGETAVWLAWHEGERSPAALARMRVICDDRRHQARRDVEARALLPLTLASAAEMHRAAGDQGRARALLQEALALAPPQWRPALAW